MAAQSLTELVTTLTPEEQAAVREFIQYLKQHGTAGQKACDTKGVFLAAADEFISQHPDLLKRLAQ